VGIPSDDGHWLELIRKGMPPLWSLLAEGSGGSVWTDGGTVAAIVPAAPQRSIFNSVFYEDGERLLSSLDSVASAYDGAGVRAWTVWVPEADERTAAGLADAGHELDANPTAMAMEISALRSPEPDGRIEFRDELDMAELARLNEIAYGWPPGDFEAVAEAKIPNTYTHFASLDGETVGCVLTWDDRDDAQVAWVATLPQARGRGVSTQLMARAIAAAGERGQQTTTLVATKLGRPVYGKVGFRDFGAIQMWERRMR
jgi:GNAT superfamily N-acetyltransferase